MFRSTVARGLGVVLSFALVAAIPAAAFADGHGNGKGNDHAQAAKGGDFDDLGNFQWASADIAILAQKGIFKGEGGGHFGPEGHLTRAQFAALMDRMFNLPQPTTPVAFVDVQSTDWAYSDIEAAAPYMSSFQTPGGTAFEPDLDVTRIEVAATIGEIEVSENLAQAPSASAAQAIWAQFKDGSDVPVGLQQDAAVAVQLGFMQGYPDGTFGVDRNLNRAEAAVLLYRVLQSTETIGGSTGGTTGGSGGGTTTTTTGYVVGDQATSVVVGVYGPAGFAVSNYALATGATITVNGTASAASALPEGDAVTVALNASGQASTVTATTPSVAVVTGTFQGASNGEATINVNGTDETVAIGSDPVVIDNEQSLGIGALPIGSAVTVAETAANGSALIITGV